MPTRGASFTAATVAGKEEKVFFTGIAATMVLNIAIALWDVPKSIISTLHKSESPAESGFHSLCSTGSLSPMEMYCPAPPSMALYSRLSGTSRIRYCAQGDTSLFVNSNSAAVLLTGGGSVSVGDVHVARKAPTVSTRRILK